jgi:hypothetical protein
MSCSGLRPVGQSVGPKKELVFGEKMTTIDNFDSVSKNLRVVLYPGRNWSPKYAMLQHIVPNTCSAVVIDSPEAVQLVSRVQLNKWKKKLPEVFQVALDNTIQNTAPKVGRSPFREKEIISLAGDLFTASLILDLRHNPDYLGKFGSLVSIPGQNVLVLYKIDDARVRNDLKFFIFVHLGVLKDQQNVVSQDIFWCNGEDIHQVEYRITADRAIECSLPKMLESALGTEVIHG